MEKLKTLHKKGAKSGSTNSNSDAKYKSIQKLTQALIEKNSIKEVAEEIVQKAIYNLGFDDCSFYLVEKKKLKLIGFQTSNLEFKEFLANSEDLSFECGVLGKVAKTGEAIISKEEKLNIDTRMYR